MANWLRPVNIRDNLLQRGLMGAQRPMVDPREGLRQRYDSLTSRPREPGDNLGGFRKMAKQAGLDDLVWMLTPEMQKLRARALGKAPAYEYPDYGLTEPTSRRGLLTETYPKRKRARALQTFQLNAF